MRPTRKLEVQKGPDGDWLYRQGGLVLGPVKGEQLIAKLYAGELDGATEVSRLGEGNFRRIRELDLLQVHLAKAEAKHRVDAVERRTAEHAVRTRNKKIGIVGVVAGVVAIAAATGASYLAIHNPWKNADELAFADISVEPPSIGLARSKSGQEDMVDYPSDGRGTKSPGGRPSGGRAVVARGIKPASEVPLGTRTDSDGLETVNIDRDGIRTVVAAHQKALYPCFVEEGKRSPGLYAVIPLEFVIGNDGRVAKLWVDNPSYKVGPLSECLLRELQKWPFHPHEGEQANVALKFTIGRRT